MGFDQQRKKGLRMNIEHIICSRNDSYGGASLSRLIDTIIVCNSFGFDVTIVDWGDVESSSLARPLSAACCRCKVLRVPPEVAETIPTDFSEVHALNLRSGAVTRIGSAGSTRTRFPE